MGLIKSVEGLKRKKSRGSPSRREFCLQTAFRPKLQHQFFPGFPVYLEGVGSLASAAAAKSLQSCLTLWPHRWQPTRLSRPWDSPGKNTRVGCHFLLQCVKVKSEVAQSLSRIRLFATPWTAPYQAPPPMGFSRQEYWSGGAIAFSVTSLYNYIKLFLR